MKIKKIAINEYGKFWKCFKNSLLSDFKYLKQKKREKMLKENWNYERLKRKLKQGNRKVWLVYDKQKIIGYLIGTEKNKQKVRLNWIWVKKDYRGKGIGKKLINKFENSLSNSNKCIYLTTSNKKNIPFYEKMGYIFFKTRKKGERSLHFLEKSA